MSKTNFVNQEIDADHVWINISKGKSVRAAVLLSIITGGYGREDIARGVYNLEDATVSTVKEMIRCANEGENIRFYVIETADVETSEEVDKDD